MRTLSDNRNNPFAVIKGVACIIVFLAHFYDCFYWYSNIGYSSAGVIGLVQRTPFYFFVCGGFMVNVFCILSGYFAYQKEIDKIPVLIMVVLKRYIRFLLPVLISNIIIVVGVKLNFFPLEDAATILDNERMPHFTDDIYAFLQSFELKSSNGALWMISPLFLGNCIIYIYSFIASKLKNQFVKGGLFIVIYVFFFSNDIVWATLTGVLLGIMMEKGDKYFRYINKMVGVVLIAFCIFWIGGADNSIMVYFPQWVKFIFSKKIQFVVVAIILCVSVMIVLRNSEKILQSRIVSAIVQNSFSIYVLHIPLIYSFSIGVWMKIEGKMRYELKFVSTLLITILLLSVLAQIYTFTVGKLCDNFLQTITDKCERGYKVK